jgi:nucleoside-diphosphate-sugar epimerase
MNERFILTGASGWFGRVALWEFERLWGPRALREQVIAYASTHKLVDIGSAYGPIKAMPLRELADQKNASGLLHLAFLTRDRICSTNIEQYIINNREITKTIRLFLEHNPRIPIITTSSGAASTVEDKELDVKADPYAVLKREEEELWKASSSTRMAVTFRVYAATGRFMKNPSIFALGDFIGRAINSEAIEIKSTRPVKRSYVNIGCLMNLCWQMMRSPRQPGYLQVNACTNTISLLELANLISEIWQLPTPRHAINQLAAPDLYTADTHQFIDLLGQYNLRPPSILEQILETSQDITAQG